MEQAILAPAGTLVGGGLAGFLAGFTARKVWNVIKLVAAAAAGLQVFVLAYLEQQGLIVVQWDSLGSALGDIGGSGAPEFIASVASAVFDVALNVLPAAAGVSAGALFGWKYAS